MVTLKMLAKECGVSVATVSKALNGAPDISTETALRIQKAASEMGYTPCAAARYLKTSRSHNIGVIFSDGTSSGLTHEHFTHVLNSFKRRAEELSYDITLISDQPGPWGNDYVNHVRFRNCDGVAVLVADNAAPVAQEFVRAGVPVVSLDYHFDNCSCIESDNVSGIRDLLEYVYRQGHRKIAVIFGDDNAVTRIRMSSFFHTCSQLGLTIPEEYVRYGRYHEGEVSARATRALMELPDPPTCILYPDDFSFFGGKRELESMGLSIPEDVSAAGYDGISVGKVVSLTTVQQDTVAIGIAAANELARAVEEGRGYLPRTEVIPCSLITGATVRKI
ncbi:MAG: LacI family DNA-binding transcriptional regulator [Faecousia sp.]